MSHPLTNHDIAHLRHEERVALGHAAIHVLEARKARSTRTKKNSAQSFRMLLNSIRRTEGAPPQEPTRTGTS